MRTNVKMVILADSAEEMRKKILDLAKVFSEEVKVDEPPQKKSKVKKEPQPDSVSLVKESPAPVLSITKEAVRAALKKVNDDISEDKAVEILSKFSCNRFSEVTEAQYSELMNECEAALK